MDKEKKHLRLIVLIILIIIFITMCAYKHDGVMKNIDTGLSTLKRLAVKADRIQDNKREDIVVVEEVKIVKERQKETLESEKKEKLQKVGQSKNVVGKSKALQLSEANESVKENQVDSDDQSKEVSTAYYHPYAEVGGIHFFNAGNPSNAVVLDLFAPIWQTPSKITFVDLRYSDRPGPPYEINLHFGYRQLSDDAQKLFGIYGAFDRKKTEGGSYFNQTTLGLEYWYKSLFLGGNYYQPLGGAKYIGSSTGEEIELYRNNMYKNIGITTDLQHEKAMPGFDAEVGYEFINGLIGYIGGYYFDASDVDAIYGPKARLTYDWYRKDGKRILGVLDKVGFMAGVQRDNPRGTTWYLGINVRLGSAQNLALEGVSRHMVDLVRRDIDVISDDYSKRESNIRKERLVAIREAKEKAKKESEANIIQLGQENNDLSDKFNLLGDVDLDELDDETLLKIAEIIQSGTVADMTNVISNKADFTQQPMLPAQPVITQQPVLPAQPVITQQPVLPPAQPVDTQQSVPLPVKTAGNRHARTSSIAIIQNAKEDNVKKQVNNVLKKHGINRDDNIQMAELFINMAKHGIKGHLKGGLLKSVTNFYQYEFPVKERVYKINNMANELFTIIANRK